MLFCLLQHLTSPLYWVVVGDSSPHRSPLCWVVGVGVGDSSPHLLSSLCWVIGVRDSSPHPSPVTPLLGCMGIGVGAGHEG